MFDRIASIDFDRLGDCYWGYPHIGDVDILSGEDINNHKYSLHQKAKKEEIYIYIHIPFCLSFCIFCPYKKYTFDRNRIADYLSALKTEITLYGKTRYLNQRKVSAIYLGGGTPNLLATEEIAGLLECCRKCFNFGKNIEVTLEAAPFALSIKKLSELLNCGINRLSLGVQTFNDRLRKFHKVQAKGKKVYDIINSAYKTGFKNINIDLMYNLPGQTLEDFYKDLKMTTGLRVENISCYNLALCRGTKLYNMVKKGFVRPNKNSLVTKMYIMKEEVLQDSGYKRYHLTAHYASKGNKFSKYYFDRLKDSSEFVGFGAGACSALGDYAYKNEVSLKRYYNKVCKGIFPLFYGLRINNDDKIRRAAIWELGTGVLKRDRFLMRFEIDPVVYFWDAIRKLKRQKLITVSKDEIRISFIGQFYWTYVCAHLFSKRILRKIYQDTKKDFV